MPAWRYYCTRQSGMPVWPQRHCGKSNSHKNGCWTTECHSRMSLFSIIDQSIIIDFNRLNHISNDSRPKINEQILAKDYYNNKSAFGKVLICIHIIIFELCKTLFWPDTWSDTTPSTQYTVNVVLPWPDCTLPIYKCTVKVVLPWPTSTPNTLLT